LQDAFHSLRQKIDDLGGTDWSMLKQENGSFRDFNEHELWLMAVEIAKTDLLRHWPPFLDWEAINATPWRASRWPLR
jgi:hypothetical protein